MFQDNGCLKTKCINKLLNMKRQDFYYELPEELIAQYPLKERSQSKLLVLDKATGKISHHLFSDLIHFLNPNDLLVFNDSKVIPARLFGQKPSGGKVEVLIERILDEHRVLAHVRASKSPKVQSNLLLENHIEVEILSRQDDLFELKFISEKKVLNLLEQYGHIPLPLYVTRPDEQFDAERYQTIYAKHKGSVAAPTAGLHFDDVVFEQLKQKEIDTTYVTLHVGAGTFKPVRVDDLTQHKMHTEYFQVSQEVCDKVKIAKQNQSRIVAVGTTSVRSLESAVVNGELTASMRETNLFIYPGFKFNVVDAMLTNFHLPESTLLMLVSAFAGYEQVMNAYREAVREKYRFFSYGDAMLII